MLTTAGCNKECLRFTGLQQWGTLSQQIPWLGQTPGRNVWNRSPEETLCSVSRTQPRVFLWRSLGVITVVTDGTDMLAVKQNGLFTNRGLQKRWL